MASKLGTLTLDLIARIGQYTEPLNEAERRTTQATDNMAESFSVAGAAASAFGAVVAGVSIGAVAEYVNGLMEMGDQLESFSKLSNSSVEKFQYFAKGAQSAGIGMEQFADQMKDMQDRIGDFQQTGGGPLADFFTNIAPLVGVTIQQFQKLSGPEALQLFYNSLEKVGATQNDIKFYMEGLIGDSSKLIPLLENGGEGFKKWGDNALAAGSIVSASTASSLASSGESIKMIMETWEGLKVQIAENVAPALALVVDNFDTIKSVALAFGAAISAKLLIQMGALSIEFLRGVAEGVRYQMALAAMAGQTITLTSATVGLRTAMMTMIGGPVGLAMLGVQALAAGAAFLYMKNKSDEVKPSLDSQKLSIEELIEKYNELGKAAKRNQQRAENAKMTDLSNSYDDAKSKMVSLVIAMGRFDDSSADAVKKANQLAMEYKQGKLTTEQLAQQINALSGVSEEAKSKIDAQAGAVSTAKNEMEQQRAVVAALVGENKQLSGSSDQVTSSINAQAQAYLALTQKQREALNGIKSDLSKDKYISTNTALGWSRDKAEFYANYREKAGLGYEGKRLSDTEISTVEQGYKLQLASKAREESEKKIEDAKKKQLEHDKKLAEAAAKKYSYTVKEEAMLRRVTEIASKNDFDSIGDKHGLPKNLLAAVMTQESKGNVNEVSPTGAIGPFQTTGVYREEYNLSKKDSYDPKKAAEVAAKDLAKSYEIFGNWTDAITAYNAGVRGTQSLLKNGFTGSVAKTKEAKEYAQKVNKWFVGLNGADAKDSGFYGEKQSDSLKEYQAYLDKTEQLRVEALARQVTIAQKYASDEQQIHLENAEAIKSINEAFTVDDSNRQKYLDLQKAVYDKDLRELEKNQEAKRLVVYNGLNDPIYAMQSKGLDALANFSMTPVQKQEWQLNNEQQDGYSGLANDLGSARSAIEDNELLTSQQKYEELENAYDVYLQNKAHLDAQYDQQYKELAQSQHDGQLQMWGTLVGQAQNTWGMMTQAVKDANGEQSASYKTMFAMQQAFAIASAIISTEQAASEALTMGPVLGIPMSTLVRTLGYANVALIAAQSIAGFATGGHITGKGTGTSDEIPIWASNGEYMLRTLAVNKIGKANLDYMNLTGELPHQYKFADGGLIGDVKVLNPQQNKDSTNFFANQKPQGSQINIINNGSSKVSARQESDGKVYVTIDDVEQWFNGSMRNANSRASKAIQQNTTASRRRK